MSTAISFPTIKPTHIFQDILVSSYSRRLLLDQSPSPAPSPYAADNNFDANVVMVLSVLLCALVCSLGLNSIIRCALRCSSLVPSEAGGNHAARLTNTGVKRKALKSFQTALPHRDLQEDRRLQPNKLVKPYSTTSRQHHRANSTTRTGKMDKVF
ncbi:hypothetical protein EUTSA_v10011772mg [Eutrema salsugineum]|uniref:RING-type E3 ubiquitin transferase n=1 Tax=Eutrema salsugineum TaxID=72664 RepID=V4KHC2_EUTSA|nr:hypothetical protein EUTSA_v10011772mg [Eutrema salsugineum]